jgi:TonB family protein
VMASGFLSFSAFAKNPLSTDGELTRKVKTKVPPTYPELARRMNIRGTVRVWVVVSPNGSIKESKAVGGNPILVNSALDALKKWKFETAPGESTGVVEFRFEDAGN